MNNLEIDISCETKEHTASQEEGDLYKLWLIGWMGDRCVDCSAAARCARHVRQSLMINADQLWVQSSIKTSSAHSL